MIVKLCCGDDFGVGSANPTKVTGETLASIESFLARASEKLIGADERDIPGLHARMDRMEAGNSAAKASVDIAAYDLMSKREKKPLYKILGGERGKMLTDITIGICGTEEAVQRALAHKREGFRALKIKVGLNVEEDIGRVRAVRNAVGGKVELRVDANQGYTTEQAVRFAEEMHSLDVAVIEQPVRAEDMTALKEVTMRSKVPVMADECVKSSLDARRMLRAGAADMINIKLMKSAGILDAMMINRLAEGTGVKTMVGCMGEIQLSIAAGLHFALSSDNVRYADLDSHFNILDDPTRGLAFEDGYLVAPDRPGLGMHTPLDE